MVCRVERIEGRIRCSLLRMTRVPGWVARPSFAKRTRNRSTEGQKMCWNLLHREEMSRTRSCGPAFTPPGTLRPRRCDHLAAGLGRSAESPGPPAGPGLGPTWRGSLSESAALLTVQLLASAALAAGLSPHIIWPQEPLTSPSSNFLLTSPRHADNCSQDSICQDASLILSLHHRITPKWRPQCRGEKGGNRVPKGCRRCLRLSLTPSLPPKPMQTTSFWQEKGTSQVPLKTRWKNQ